MNTCIWFLVTESPDLQYNDEFVMDEIVQRGCSTVLMGQMMYFGGFPNSQKYFTIKNCEMKREYSKLPFHYYDGSCNSFLEPSPKVLLCFSSFTIPKVTKCHT